MCVHVDRVLAQVLDLLAEISMQRLISMTAVGGSGPLGSCQTLWYVPLEPSASLNREALSGQPAGATAVERTIIETGTFCWTLRYQTAVLNVGDHLFLDSSRLDPRPYGLGHP